MSRKAKKLVITHTKNIQRHIVHSTYSVPFSIDFTIATLFTCIIFVLFHCIAVFIAKAKVST